jgi:acyl carrier protein
MTQQLKDAFVEVLGIDPGSDFDHLAYGSTEGWDSTAHMALVAEIESKFDIMLTTDDLIAMSSFGKAKEIIGKYGIAFNS